LFLVLQFRLISHASDSGIIAIENGLIQRGAAMLFFFLVPWIAFCLCLASPLPGLFPARFLKRETPA
jgi:hypothetical protein